MYDILIKLILIPIYISGTLSQYNISRDSNCEQKFQIEGDENCHCGTISRPDGADLFVKTLVNNEVSFVNYNEDIISHNSHSAEVWYSCTDKTDILVGNYVRKCHRGNWLGKLPRCAYNYLNKTELSSIEILENGSIRRRPINLSKEHKTMGAFTPAGDRPPNGCLKWSASRQHLVLRLKNEADIQYIRMRLYAQNLQHLWSKSHFKINVFLNYLSNISCEYNDKPNVNQLDRIENQNKNYLTLEYECGPQTKNYSKNVSAIYITISLNSDSKQIFWISLCDLRLYGFADICGLPDYPLLAIVRNAVHENNQYEYLCKYNELVLEGNAHIKCGTNGKWLDEFPHCIPRDCKALSIDQLDQSVQIKYESIKYKDNETFISDGKKANITCNPSWIIEQKSNQSDYQIQGASRPECSKGKWVGLSPAPKCIKKDTYQAQLKKITKSKRIIIRILCAVLALTVILIVCLVFFMFRARKARNRKKLEELKARLANDYVDYESFADFERYSTAQTIDEKSNNEYFNCYYSIENLNSLQTNPLYKDDVSDCADCQKANSIYSAYK